MTWNGDEIGMRYKIYVGWLRYSGNKQRWIAATVDGYGMMGVSLTDAFDDLDVGDADASAALDFITSNADLFEFGSSASSAVAALEKSIQDKINDKD